MAENEYMDFIHCRQTKFFSKGIKPVLTWLELKRDGTELKFRKVLEAFGYIMRFVLQKIVLQAVKLESDTGSSLVPVTTPIAEASYQRASEII
jgi:hypothetical protein